MNLKKIILLGAGGHAAVLLDTLISAKYKVYGILDSGSKKTKELFQTPIIGDDSLLDDLDAEEYIFVNAVGRNGYENKRSTIFEKLKRNNFKFLNVIHPSSIVSPFVDLSEGIQIMAGAIIQSRCFIDDNVVINTGAKIDHDCHIGKHVFIGPGAIISGGVRVNDYVFIGAGAILNPGIEVGESAVIGAGAVVNKNIPEHVLVVGIPAIVKRTYI